MAACICVNGKFYALGSKVEKAIFRNVRLTRDFRNYERLVDGTRNFGGSSSRANCSARTFGRRAGYVFFHRLQENKHALPRVKMGFHVQCYSF